MGVTALLRGSLTISVAILLAGCHSQREIVSHISTSSQTHDTTAIETASTTRENTWESVIEMCKKLDLHISADSIVTPESVIYRPTIVMQADQPVRVREQTAEEESTDSIHIERQTYIDTDSTAAVRDTRETTAVAEPPSILSVYALLALLAVIAIMIKTIHSKKT